MHGTCAVYLWCVIVPRCHCLSPQPCLPKTSGRLIKTGFYDINHANRHFSNSNSTVPTRTITSQPELPKNRIPSLPTELIRDIFFYYYQFTKAPILLLLICRQWHDIALTMSSLWTTIHFLPSRWMFTHAPITTTMHMPVTCFSFRQLERATRRAMPALVSFICDPSYVPYDANAHSWLSTRCRFLQLATYSLASEGLLHLFRNTPELEALALDVQSSSEETTTVRGFIRNLELHSPRLTSLEVFGCRFPTTIFRHPLLLKRLRKLVVRTLNSSSLSQDYERGFTYMTNLEEVHWPFNESFGLGHIATNLRILSIETYSISASIPFPRLTSLTLSCNNNQAVQYPLMMPSLEYLSFKGESTWVSKLIAPKLHTLDLSWWYPRDGRNDDPQVSISPKSLTIRAVELDSCLLQLLSNQWSEVEELLWDYWSFDSIMQVSALVDALLGTNDETPRCPRLRSFTIKTKRPKIFGEIVADQIEAQLHRMVDGRFERGVALKRVRWVWNEVQENRLGLVWHEGADGDKGLQDLEGELAIL